MFMTDFEKDLISQEIIFQFPLYEKKDTLIFLFVLDYHPFSALVFRKGHSVSKVEVIYHTHSIPLTFLPLF